MSALRNYELIANDINLATNIFLRLKLTPNVELHYEDLKPKSERKCC